MRRDQPPRDHARSPPSPTSIGSSGATATAICSAIRPPKSGVNSSFSAGDRQVDEPRPVDVGAGQPVLGEIVPALAGEQAADLHHPHIVVGVAEREDADRAPAVARA